MADFYLHRRANGDSFRAMKVLDNAIRVWIRVWWPNPYFFVLRNNMKTCIKNSDRHHSYDHTAFGQTTNSLE